jgi:pyruvate,water dikinase
MDNVIIGKVAIIKNEKDYYKIKKETILVAKNTHPDLVIVINKIKGIVTEIDNKLCHAAIVAREFNKPLLMGVFNATKKFKTGEKVLVDFGRKTINKIA